MGQNWQLYILRCVDGTLYTGIAVNIQKRLAMHRSGKGAKYTRGRGPLELVYSESCGSHSDALRRELEVKRLPREEKEKLIQKKEKNMTKKPVIGVISAKHQYEILLPVYSTGAHYVEQIAAAGAIPVQIPVRENMTEEEMTALTDRCDGFLFPGGADFDPEWYGETLPENLSPDSGRLDKAVQESALRLIRIVAATGKPILGICLGAQIINVAFGGSLIQDIPTQVETDLIHASPMNVVPDRWAIAHTVRTAEDSLIRRISGAEDISVNSFHHQAVKNIAPGFRATAWAPDGVIEAIENDGGNILAVQWHPENLSHASIPEACALFRWLAEQSAQ